MAIVSVGEKPASRVASMNALWQRTYTRVFLVVTDSYSVGGIAVRNAIDPNTGVFVPGVGAYYTIGTEHDFGSFVQSVSARQAEQGNTQWEVTVEYGPYDANQFPINPIDWPTRLSFAAQKYERVVYEDKDGNAITNSAKEPFKDPVTIDDSRPVITVTRNELISTFDPTIADQYRDKVNDATWNGFSAGYVKCNSITTSDPQYDSNAQVWYYEVTYVFEFNRDTWSKVILDQGFSYLDGSSPPKQKQIVGTDGQPLSEPTLLDSSGHQLASTGSPHFITFNVYPTADFSAFDIDFATALGR